MVEGLKVKLAPMGGGRGGDAKMVSHYREEGEGGGSEQEDGSQAGVVTKLQATKGQQEKQPGPFQGAGMGDKPQVAQDTRARRHPALPLPHPKLRNGDWQQQPLGSARAWGGGWRAGSVPNQMPPAWAWWLPAHNVDPTSPSPEPLCLEL